MSGDTDRRGAFGHQTNTPGAARHCGNDSPDRPHQAIQALAMAILHVAENIEQMRATLEEMKSRLARLSSLPETSQNVAPPRRPTRAKRKETGAVKWVLWLGIGYTVLN